MLMLTLTLTASELNVPFIGECPLYNPYPSLRRFGFAYHQTSPLGHVRSNDSLETKIPQARVRRQTRNNDERTSGTSHGPDGSLPKSGRERRT